MANTSLPLPLHVCRVLIPQLIINRVYMVLLGIALSLLIYYRTTTISHIVKTREAAPLLPHVLIFFGELIFIFIWIIQQGYRWRPVYRTVYPERLPADIELPPVDVFICTADPSKEPSLGVMNTVISAMALDYPTHRLAVYLQDDGGSYVTLEAMKEAWKFAKWWLPFSRKYQLKTRCPQAYFLAAESVDDKFITSSEFMSERKEIEKRYEEFKEILGKNSVNASASVSRDHPPIIEVLRDGNGDAVDSCQQEMPILVYVSREKRPGHSHHAKAGAVNSLLRVSAIISNAPYVLLLDCDHYCNDPTSARQAMCYYFDPEISPKLGYVQFPQHFNNMSKYDIYDGSLAYYWRRWFGFDGVGGPAIAGCNLYLRREILYKIKNENDLNQLKRQFGSSNELIKSITKKHKTRLRKDRKLTETLQNELQLVASCSYDDESEWGKEVGFAYFSVVEDFITSIFIHCRGWSSVWVDPPRPNFLGSCMTSLSDMLVQQARWGIGLMQVFMSKYCGLVYGLGKIPMLQCMCYVASSIEPIGVFPFYIIAIIPQICLLHGVPIYPKVSDPIFAAYAFIFVSSQLKHVEEVLSYGHSLRTALYESRVWMMKSASCYLYATWGAVMDKIGLNQANFTLTDKVVDDEQEKRFQDGIYDFQGSSLVIAPICTLYVLNLACFIIGVTKIVLSQKGEELLLQAVIPLFGIIVNYHVLEGMFLRKDKGRVSLYVSLLSAAIAAGLLCFGSLIVMF